MDTEFMFRLRKAMADKNITASELSRISGVGKSDISYYLKGKYVPKQDKCYLLAKALGVDPGWLMTGLGNETKEILDGLKEAEEELPRTKEARILAKGIDKMPDAQRKALITLMEGLYPGIFKEEDDET